MRLLPSQSVNLSVKLYREWNVYFQMENKVFVIRMKHAYRYITTVEMMSQCHRIKSILLNREERKHEFIKNISLTHL